MTSQALSDSDFVSGRTLLVVGGRPASVRKAVGLGLDVVLLQHREHFAPETADLCTAVILADYTDWKVTEPLVAAAHQVYGFGAVVSLTEPGLEPAGRINDLCGLDGNTAEVARLLKDKLAMRHHLDRVGGAAAAANVPAAEVTGEDSLRAFGEEHGYPFIVKPANVTASLGVHKVTAPERIPETWAAVRRLRARTDLQWGAFFEIDPHLAEEYVEGPEYSVEAYTFASRHVVVAITEKISSPDGFIELGHAQPARIGAAEERALTACATAFLDAVGQRTGASHTEIKLTEHGPKVIEGHNRIGGDRIVDLLELSYDVDFELLTVGVPFGLCPELAAPPPLVRPSATRFLVADPGVVARVDGADAVRDRADVVALDLTVTEGDTVRPGSNWDRCGQVIVAGSDATTATDTVVRAAEECAKAITIETTPEGRATGKEA